MPSATDFLDAAPSASAFLDATPSPTPSGTPEGGTWFLPRSGAQMDVDEARQGAELAQPIIENPQVGGVFTGLSRAVPKSLDDLVRMAILPREGNVDEQMQQSEDWGKAVRGEYGPVEQAATLTQTAMAAAPLAHIPIAEDVPPPLRTEPLAPEPPPTQSMGPGTTAADVSNALEWTPQSAPVTPLEEAVAKVQPPGPQVSPETGFTIYPGLEGHAPVPSDWAYPVPPPGTPLQGVPLVLNGETPAANLVQSQPVPPNAPLPNGQPQVAIPPGDEPYAGVTPQTTTPATEGVGGNVKGFEQVYGPGEVPAGPTLTPEDAWDAAKLRAQLGQSNPYGFVARAKTGAITPAEMGDLIYEHHRLVERAAGLEGTPDYEGAYQAASDFANNVLKPAQNAWHQKGMTMQIAQPVDFSTETGMRNAMDRMNVELKANQASEAKRIVRENSKAKADVNGAEDNLMKAMDKEYSKGEKRAPKTAEQLRAQLAETEPCAL